MPVVVCAVIGAVFMLMVLGIHTTIEDATVVERICMDGLMQLKTSIGGHVTIEPLYTTQGEIIYCEE